MSQSFLFDDWNEVDAIEAIEAGTEYFIKRGQARAAEYLVMADLAYAGYDCSLAAEGLRYDLIVDSGSRLHRVQVKSAAKMRTESKGTDLTRTRYFFGFGSREKGLSSYVGHADVFALVAQDKRLIIYQCVSADRVRARFLPKDFSEQRQAMTRQLVFGEAGVCQ